MSLVTDRQRVLFWARELVANENWVTFDSETTGLESDDQIIQWAVCAPDGTILGQGYVKPTVPVTEGARAIHGISDETLAEAPTFDQGWPQIWRLIEGKLVVIYNASFDRSRLYSSARPYRIELPDFPSVCEMHKYAVFHGEVHSYYGDYIWQRLETACRTLGIEMDGAHDAGHDARATALIVQAMAKLAATELPVGFKLPVDVKCAGGCKSVVKESLDPEEVWYCQGCGLRLGLYHRCPKCQARVIQTPNVEEWCGWCQGQKEVEDKLVSGEWHKCGRGACRVLVRVPVTVQAHCDYCTKYVVMQAAEEARRVADRKAHRAKYMRDYRKRQKEGSTP